MVGFGEVYRNSIDKVVKPYDVLLLSFMLILTSEHEHL